MKLSWPAAAVICVILAGLFALVMTGHSVEAGWALVIAFWLFIIA